MFDVFANWTNPIIRGISKLASTTVILLAFYDSTTYRNGFRSTDSGVLEAVPYRKPLTYDWKGYRSVEKAVQSCAIHDGMSLFLPIFYHINVDGPSMRVTHTLDCSEYRPSQDPANRNRQAMRPLFTPETLRSLFP
jgi:hypothetical protein